MRRRKPFAVAWGFFVGIGAALGGAVAYVLGRRLGPARAPHMRGVALIAWSFILSFAAFVALAVVYALGGQTQIEGSMLFVGLGGLSVGLIAWAHTLMPQEPFVEPRPITFDEPRERADVEEEFVVGTEQIGRRRFLGTLFGAALAGLGAVLLFPIRSLGTRPGRSLFVTPWGPGARAVTQDGKPVAASSLLENSVLTVFPEGHTDAADAQTLLIKTDPATFRPLAGRETWSPEGIVAYSKICTHAGCPVGLYQASTSQLFCPCHQSVFSVPDGAKPTAGPATKPLPQLPLAIDSDGFIVAQSDYTEPVGPEFWNFGR